MAKPLLLFSFRNSIPLVGLSSSWVKAGALYALEWDYADLGAQAGEMALGILRGARPSAIPTAPPRKTFYTLNLKTAEQMKIQFSDEQKARARAIY
jgi:putative ABC transport system substrate-binding protein